MTEEAKVGDTQMKNKDKEKILYRKSITLFDCILKKANGLTMIYITNKNDYRMTIDEKMSNKSSNSLESLD